MTDSRDEQQGHADSRNHESAESPRMPGESPASSQDQDEKDIRARSVPYVETGSDTGTVSITDTGPYGGGGTHAGEDSGDDDGASRVVTAVNPRIVPAGSRSPAPPPPPPSRTRRAVLAAVAALALAGLSTGAYMLFGADEDRRVSGPGVTPGPEWEGGQENEAPGSASPPAESSPGKDKDGDKDKDKDKEPGRSSPSESSGDGDGDKDRPPQDGDGHDSQPQNPPGGSGGGNGPDGTVKIWNHNSDQCINVAGGDGRDGMPLEINTCSDAESMQWTFESDGTVRALGLCMDVANGSSENGTVIQLAYCSGNPAQQFRLSEGSDLVNPQADKCVAVRDDDVRPGQRLQLWDCNGLDSQKWSPV
ncbi:RICIN domain-containing protein [Streptomyces winkii]|uniref:RICIN domain-containing protein n=1 Tax=Streptomyces winkii TaxID=3051178 RepID=UPI0028D3F49D|nr:RICIN domain-containing protein [Streptomyces sp. DSM 40971]